MCQRLNYILNEGAEAVWLAQKKKKEAFIEVNDYFDYSPKDPSPY